MKKIGIIIIIIGLCLSLFNAFTYFTREKVVGIGKVEIIADKPHHLRWSPIVGIVIMGIGGLVLLIYNKK